MRRTKLVQWIIVWTLAISGFSIMIYGFYLNDFYSRTAPSMPDEANGRVVKVNIDHGKFVYLTPEEDMHRNTIFVGVIIGMIGGLMAKLWNIGQPPAPQGTIKAYVPPLKKKWMLW